MSAKLRRNEPCPIHHGSRVCCGREPRVKTVRHIKIQGAVTRVPDDTTEKGYRELCSNPELKRRKDKKIREQQGICALCHEPMDDYREIEVDHIIPKGLGGSTRDDSLDNLQATCKVCNRKKGSQRNYTVKESQL